MLAAAAAVSASASIYQWPDTLGNAWLFDRGSAHGFQVEAGLGDEGQVLRGPAPDWALGAAAVPTLGIGAGAGKGAGGALAASHYPGTVLLTRGGAPGELRASAQLVFASASTALARLSLQGTGEPSWGSFQVWGRATNSSVGPAGVIAFALPAASKDTPCLAGPSFGGGSFQFARSVEFAGSSETRPLEWQVKDSPAGFTAASARVLVPAASEAVTYLTIRSTLDDGDKLASQLLGTAGAARAAFDAAIGRWDGYLSRVLGGETAPAGAGALNMSWASVKSVQTLIHNWRFVPGFPDGALPSYVGYDSGFWSWDSYKIAVGMVTFAPDIAMQQLRLMVAARDVATGHIPDKVDRCGRGGGCSGKPPLLSWAVWEVFKQTRDAAFLREMYPAVESFHHFWYTFRDVKGVGLCSWTEGMESGMDDGVRFMPKHARGERNATSHVSTLDFWSTDLNSYLYLEKVTLAAMAQELGNATGSRHWAAEAAALLPRLRSTFFVPGASAAEGGFFQDVYFNGTAMPVQGCEGHTALFAGVATVPQAFAVAKTLRDPARFLLNFSLPTVSKQDPDYGPRTYWKGSTWLDQTWFAYTGLRRYAHDTGSDELDALATEIRRRVFEVGRGFKAGDVTPLNEHYDPQTGEPIGAPHFGWSAAHTLMWQREALETFPGVRTQFV